MIVNTRRSFIKLLRTLQIDTVFDVGSMNGADALAFRSAAPQANIYALEPNPENFRLMQADPALRERGVQLLPVAATDHDGEAEFFLVKADYSLRHDRRGMSSLYRRFDGSELAAVARVKTARLDTLLREHDRSDARLALWIDVEGKAYEALAGASGLVGQLHLLHVEVETSPCIGPNQKLYPEVKSLLRSQGFIEVATDRPVTDPQFNALFVRRHAPVRTMLAVRALLLVAGLRRSTGVMLSRVLPAAAFRLITHRS